MTIGIIVAMTKELNLLLPLMDNRETRKAGGTEFHLGNIGTNRVALMECGMGEVPAGRGAVSGRAAFRTDLG
ncbi:MAG: 5'-nucleosidase, partial [Duncaniella sp.]|nr:5'-nucleosidase [Duncaniella sp.]